MTKKELRTKIKSIISETEKEYFISADKKIAENVINSLEFERSNTIFIYISTDSEPSTKEIILKALNAGKTVCVPKCISKSEMLAIKINGLDELKPGYFGILEPESTENAMNRQEIDMAIIPCVSASYKKERLGHGAGYYDRFLPNMDAHKMCLCYEKLISEKIPTEQNDIKMDSLITEKCSLF